MGKLLDSQTLIWWRIGIGLRVISHIWLWPLEILSGTRKRSLLRNLNIQEFCSMDMWNFQDVLVISPRFFQCPYSRLSWSVSGPFMLVTYLAVVPCRCVLEIFRFTVRDFDEEMVDETHSFVSLTWRVSQFSTSSASHSRKGEFWNPWSTINRLLRGIQIHGVNDKFPEFFAIPGSKFERLVGSKFFFSEIFRSKHQNFLI